MDFEGLDAQALANDQAEEIERHERRYKAAIDMIQRKEKRIREVSNHLLRLRAEIVDVTSQVRALKDVPAAELDDAIGRVANALDTAVLR